MTALRDSDKYMRFSFNSGADISVIFNKITQLFSVG
jgi:hypothetical protein